MSEKKYSPKEVALAVLAKAAEVVNNKMEKGDWAKIHRKLEREGYSKESADKIDGAIKAKLNKDEKMPEANGHEPNLKKDMGDMGDMMGSSDMAMSEKQPPANGSGEPKMKGHIKLAKFMGRMEHKRGKPAQEMDKAQEDPAKMSGKTGMVGSGETGKEKGVNIRGNNGSSHGMSEAGASVRNAAYMGPKANGTAMASAKERHKNVLGEMKQMPKPKLPA